MVDPECPNFFDEKDYRYQKLRAALDNLGRRLRKDGIGAEVKHASIVTSEEEDALWLSGVLGSTTPKALLNVVFFFSSGKNFCLRGGSEHKILKLSQLKHLYNPDHHIYTENGSKSHSRCLKEKSIENKTTPIVSCYAQFGERCHVYFLDRYIEKMPLQAKESDVFYLRPFHNFAKSSEPWYCDLPLGVHKLSGMGKEKFSAVGIDEKQTTAIEPQVQALYLKRMSLRRSFKSSQGIAL